MKPCPEKQSPKQLWGGAAILWQRNVSQTNESLLLWEQRTHPKRKYHPMLNTGVCSHSTNRLQIIFMWIQTLGWIYTQSWRTRDALMSGSCLSGDVPCWWCVVQPLSPAPFFNKKVTITAFWGRPSPLWWQPGEAMLGSCGESPDGSSWGTSNQIFRLGPRTRVQGLLHPDPSPHSCFSLLCPPRGKLQLRIAVGKSSARIKLMWNNARAGGDAHWEEQSFSS